MGTGERRLEKAITELKEALAAIDEDLSFAGRTESNQRKWASQNYMFVEHEDAQANSYLRASFTNCRGNSQVVGDSDLTDLEAFIRACVLERLQDSMMHAKRLSSDAVEIGKWFKNQTRE